ncbi:hypothetical protein IWW57_006246, partial [Coemansia sp. S610]
PGLASADNAGDSGDNAPDDTSTGVTDDSEPVNEQPMQPSESVDSSAATVPASSRVPERPRRAAAIRSQQATTETINYKAEDINEFLAAASVSGPPSYNIAM